MLERFTRIFTDEKKEHSEDLSRLQDILQVVLDALTDKDLLDYAILEDQVIGTSTTLVSHRLGRKYRWWIVVDKNADARVWRDTTSTADTSTYLPLKASAEVTADILVF